AGGSDRRSLRADCEHCVGLCCVAPAFSASADFAIDKDAGQACPHLRPEFRCGIHARLRQRGFPGCAVYDCFGAGQKVSQVTFAGQDWRQAPRIAQQMFEVFTIMRQLHELLWYLAEALTLEPARPLHEELGRALDETERLTLARPEALMELDVAAHRDGVNALLVRTSELARAAGRPHSDLGHGDLKDLRGADLIGADLRRADLRSADLTGADFRGADLGGADLTRSIFLIQSQLEAAKGDHGTQLPPVLTRPAHWLTRRYGVSRGTHPRSPGIQRGAGLGQRRRLTSRGCAQRRAVHRPGGAALRLVSGSRPRCPCPASSRKWSPCPRLRARNHLRDPW